MVTEDPKSAEIIKPILRGRDIKRYCADWAEKWLIDSHNGYGDTPPIDINEYPIVKNYLNQYWKQISARQDRGVTPYNLRNCAYHEQLQRMNIVWQRITQRPAFCLSKPGQYVLDSMVFISANPVVLKFLLPILNSSIVEYWVHHNVHKLGKKGFLLSNQYVALLPIPKMEECNTKIVEELSVITDESINTATGKKNFSTLQCRVDKMVYKMFGLNDAEEVEINRLINSH